MTTTMLSQTLGHMVDGELLVKTAAGSVFPPSAVYDLSSRAQELAAEDPRMIAWAYRHADLLERAGQRRRKRRRTRE